MPDPAECGVWFFYMPVSTVHLLDSQNDSRFEQSKSTTQAAAIGHRADERGIARGRVITAVGPVVGARAVGDAGDARGGGAAVVGDLARRDLGLDHRRRVERALHRHAVGDTRAEILRERIAARGREARHAGERFSAIAHHHLLQVHVDGDRRGRWCVACIGSEPDPSSSPPPDGAGCFGDATHPVTHNTIIMRRDIVGSSLGWSSS